ncbi:phospholipase C, phosphocholine-specific [Danxiaibacter flavus]|uniref:phospholipase C n=1 Tax=Danxiaibacter flavus TaxID=3049108 RepID=A0ABV3ZLC3_9BACT|nr:phospholipase C, phosphocholine-specific [Chitinophagaceae bacterium DXS]
MDSRREFLKKAALLSGGAGLWNALPASVQKALAINPAEGSTYLDAEHIVFLMQENRSFDHCYGTLQGVRGFNDPRAINLPNKNLVWAQYNEKGETYAPFRLNIKDTKATWMSSLPHSWENQVDARNDGKYDKWLDVKKSGHKEFADMPMTMGYYNREDIPFYYALADAFTVCDQHFCSSLTGTTPNRLYFWTGTVREEQNGDVQANIRNEEVDYGAEAHWKTFPERLEENNVSWKIYQNEISLDSGFEGEEDGWLANFTDNPIEWFTQYNVRFSKTHLLYAQKQVNILPGEIKKLEEQIAVLPASDDNKAKLEKQLKEKKEALTSLQEDLQKYTPENFAKLSQLHQNIHSKAFTTNVNDPYYRELSTLKYNDGTVERGMKVPKGDVLHQFREDVKNGKLPTVSWLVAPENFSDHPGAPWYGAWYVSEVLDILTQNPEVWKKTIFILTYDENDGCFDHVPPFVAPHFERKDTGTVSKGIDTRAEWVTMEQELKRKPKKYSRESPIGLGYRVPLVIASPWSRGGWVNSEVFDHTSNLQFLEIFLQHKLKKEITESNITDWRRTVCGDLTSVFRPYNGEKIAQPEFLAKDAVLESIHKAQFKKLPSDFKLLTKEEVQQINQNPSSSPYMPKQEKGIRSSCVLPYEIYVDGNLSGDKQIFRIQLTAATDVFGTKASGVPFNIYAPGKYLQANENGEKSLQPVKTWSYAVAAGDTITDEWSLSSFENQSYHLRVYGPNGFYREFIGNSKDPITEISCKYELEKNDKKKLTGNVQLFIRNASAKGQVIEIIDNAYKSAKRSINVNAGSSITVIIDTSKSHNWYDFTARVKGFEEHARRYAGRVENGKPTKSDPLMGGVV